MCNVGAMGKNELKWEYETGCRHQWKFIKCAMKPMNVNHAPSSIPEKISNLVSFTIDGFCIQRWARFAQGTPFSKTYFKCVCFGVRIRNIAHFTHIFGMRSGFMLLLFKIWHHIVIESQEYKCIFVELLNIIAFFEIYLIRRKLFEWKEREREEKRVKKRKKTK